MAGNVAAWLWAYGAFGGRPALLGSALLAWLFGIRHAADADHLAAIDNVVRKLVQQGQRPHLVGLFFSLGHSTVVVLACALIAATASGTAIEWLRNLGAVVGTAVSAGFLVLIAAVNMWTLAGLLRGRGGAGAPAGGLLARLLRPASRIIRRPSHMFPLGFLFGLGFDTATEVGLLTLAATQAAAGVSFVQVLIFPSLFTAGMALVDTADSVLMVGAYGWALVDPGRKFAYNVTVTAVSILLALVIGGVEAAGLLADQTGAQGWAWDAVAWVADAFSSIGFGVGATFLAAWAVAAAFYRRRVAGETGGQVAVQPPST